MSPKKIAELTNKLYRLEKELSLKTGCKSHLFIKLDNNTVKCEHCNATKRIILSNTIKSGFDPHTIRMI